MAGSAIVVAIKTTDVRPAHDDIMHGCIASTDVSRADRVMAVAASLLMQGGDTIGPVPCVGKDRIPGSGATTLMATIAGQSDREICGPHGYIVLSWLSSTMQMCIKVSRVTICTVVWPWSKLHIGGRSDQEGATNTVLMTSSAATCAMHAGNDLALWCCWAATTNAMTDLAGSDPGEGSIPFYMAAVARAAAGMTIKTTDISTIHDNIGN